MTTATKVAHNSPAETTVGIESAAGKSQHLLSGGFAAAVQMVAGLTVDGYQRIVTQQAPLVGPGPRRD